MFNVNKDKVPYAIAIKGSGQSHRNCTQKLFNVYIILKFLKPEKFQMMY